LLAPSPPALPLQLPQRERAGLALASDGACLVQLSAPAGVFPAAPRKLKLKQRADSPAAAERAEHADAKRQRLLGSYAEAAEAAEAAACGLPSVFEGLTASLTLVSRAGCWVSLGWAAVGFLACM
jgi:hypothetical protein